MTRRLRCEPMNNQMRGPAASEVRKRPKDNSKGSDFSLSHGAQAAPAPRPSPVLAKPETWPEAMRRYLLPRPAWSAKGPSVDAATTWSTLKARARTSTARSSVEAQAALLHLAHEACPFPAALEVELGLALLCLSQPQQAGSAIAMGRDLTLLLDHWATHGGEHLLRCGLALLGGEAPLPSALSKTLARWSGLGPWRCMAAHLAPLPAKERARLAALARGNAFAWAIFPESGEADAALRGGSTDLRALAGLTEVESLTGFLPTHARQLSLGGYEDHYSPLPILLTWLATWGAEALPFLEVVLARLLEVAEGEQEIRRDVAHVLGFMGTPRAFELLCAHAEDCVFAAVLCESAIAAPQHAATALLQGTAQPGAAGNTCATILKQVMRERDHAHRVTHRASRADAAELPSWLQSPGFAWLAPALPVFANPSALPLLKLDATGKALPDEAALQVLRMFAHAPVKAIRAVAPSDELLRLKAMLSRTSMGAFALALFRAWLASGGETKDAWCFLVMGCFGDDSCAREAGSLLQGWSKAGLTQHAEMGITVLEGIGSDEALMQLHHFAQHTLHKPLQRHARYVMGAIAKARCLTREELADRLVPDLGLDGRGTRTLEVGSRRFHVGFDAALMPSLREGDIVLTGLPKASPADRLAHRAAASAWRSIQAESRDIAPQQVRRLELAMCTRRRWSAPIFQRCFATHPWMQHLAQRLVWGTYNERGTVEALFCVVDGALRSTAGGPFTLLETANIGVPHRLELTEERAAALTERFARDALVQPFAQLTRKTHALTPAEVKSGRLVRWLGRPITHPRLFSLEVRGWMRERPSDHGVMALVRDALRISLTPGLRPVAEATPQEVSWAGPREGIRLAQVHPILLSELIHDIESVMP